MTKDQTLIALVITTIINAFLIMYLSKKKSKNQLNKVFVWALSLLILWSVGLIAQITLAEPLNIEPIYFDYFVYIGACFVPVAVFFMGLIYANTKIEFKKRYLLLFIIPIISLLVLWTNDYHHLFYKHYSVDFQQNVYGPYATIHNIYAKIFNKEFGIFLKTIFIDSIGSKRTASSKYIRNI